MKWLQGKKTYIAAAGLTVLALFGYWSGALSEGGTSILLMQALGLVGLRSALAQHQKEVMATLAAAKQIAPKPPRRIAAVVQTPLAKAVAEELAKNAAGKEEAAGGQ